VDDNHKILSSKRLPFLNLNPFVEKSLPIHHPRCRPKKERRGELRRLLVEHLPSPDQSSGPLNDQCLKRRLSDLHLLRNQSLAPTLHRQHL
jgi:hypothetical protein